MRPGAPRSIAGGYSRPLNVVVFASGGGGNLRAAIRLAVRRPDLVRIGAVVTDRLGIPALRIAEAAGIPTIARDFEQSCARWADVRDDPAAAATYRRRARDFHDRVLDDLMRIEASTGAEFGLAVLSYRRWIHGNLLTHFADRMINQHPADLAALRPDGIRRYTGIGGLRHALEAGEPRTRTSTILVGDGHDTGEVLCQGPWIETRGTTSVSPDVVDRHEHEQKQVSDWPSLTFALAEIAQGAFAVADDEQFPDGCRVLYHRGRRLPYGGVDLDGHVDADLDPGARLGDRRARGTIAP